MRLTHDEECGTQGHMRQGVFGTKSRELAEDVHGLRGLAAQDQRLSEAAQRDTALGSNSRGDGEEPDCLVRAARSQQFPSEIGVDPEVVAM